MAVAVQVAGTDGEGRGHLRFDGQGARLEVIAAIEKYGRFQPVRLPGIRGRQTIAQDFLDTGLTVSLVRGKARPQKGQRLGHRFQAAFGNDFLHLRVVVGFDDLHGLVAVEAAIIDPQRVAPPAFVFAVPAPIGSDDIEPSVAVEIARCHPIPPALETVQPQLRGGVGEPAVIVAEDAHRPPFARED